MRFCSLMKRKLLLESPTGFQNNNNPRQEELEQRRMRRESRKHNYFVNIPDYNNNMYHQYNDVQNVRMPRACKKTKKLQTQPPPNTRKPKKQTHQNSPRYAAPPQVPAQSSQYPMTEHRSIDNHSNQVLYPNMLHVPTSATYSMNQQPAQPTADCSTMTEQYVAPRYNTRRAVHNLPLAAAPTKGRYWNTSARPPVTQLDCGTQQMSTPTPVARPVPPRTKEEGAQTDLSFTPDEIKLLKTLRAKKTEISRVTRIFENDDYIVTYDKQTVENEQEQQDDAINTETFQEVVRCSDASRRRLFNLAYGLESPQRNVFGCPVPYPSLNVSRAIGCDTESLTGQGCSPPSCLLQSEEEQLQDIPSQPSLLMANTAEATMCTNNEVINPLDPTLLRPQVTEQRTTPPVSNHSYSIPRFSPRYFHNNTRSRYPQAYPGFNGSQPHRGLSCNFLQAAAVYIHSRLRPNNPHAMNEMPRWFPNPDFFPPRPPWI